MSPPPARPAQPPIARPVAGPEVPLLVCLHGWLLSGRLWDPLQEALAPRWPVWAPDLPGFGQRPRPRSLQPTLASYGRWVAQASVREAHGRPIVLVGHSLGGSVALHAAAALGDQLLALVQISTGGGVYQPRPFARLRWAGSAVVRLRPRWLADLPGVGAFRSPLVADQRAARGLLACSTNRRAVHQLPTLTARLSVPSLWISGSRDGVMEPRYVRHLAGYAPLHEVELLEGMGHLPMRQDPGQLASLIDRWLEPLVAERPQSLASPRSWRSASWA
nr:alpha/beta hydrolase [Cyanobium sp. Morenito 9A2]